MATTNPTKLANIELIEIWKKALCQNEWPTGIKRMWPLQYQSMQPGKLLFIGLNPSDSSDSELLTLRDPWAEDLGSVERAEEVLRRDEDVMSRPPETRHQYFSKFDSFLGENQWNHLDLLAVRHTKQSELKSALSLDFESDCEQRPANWFVAAQLDECHELAAALAPPCVVVVNALASGLLMAHLKKHSDLTFDPAVGYHSAQLGSRMIPWFFSGMLTGQRALDNHSFKRLTWHVTSGHFWKSYGTQLGLIRFSLSGGRQVEAHIDSGPVFPGPDPSIKLGRLVVIHP